MIGLLLITASTFFQEIGASIGKKEVEDHKESIYTMGFLSLAVGTLFFLLIVFLKNEFIFSLASLPTLGVRIVLEIAQAHMTMLAIAYADRSTTGFLRIGTIPLLLATDIFLGYTINFAQIIGISLIAVALIFLLINHGIRKKGIGYIIFTTINAVITLSLFKYNITNFNSVEAEQSIVMSVLIIYFLIMAFFIAKENPIKFLKKPIFIGQSFSEGIGAVLGSFAYLFAPASIITTAKRSLSVLWSIVAGKVYFHEKHLIIKLMAFTLIIGGLVLLVV